MTTPRGIKYQSPGLQYERQHFPEEYFTGCDITVYFGDVWVDEIVNLEFSLTEAVRPIYGYASRTADTFARGTRIVVGRFSIAFREAGYLNAVMGHLAQAGKENAKPREAYILANKPEPDWIANSRETIDEYMTRKGLNPGQVKSYEQELWGREFSTDKDRRYRTYFYDDRQTLGHQDRLLRDGFDIYITYGALHEQLRQGQATANTTVKAIRGIHINAVHTVHDASGNPIQEVYEFIAKDLD